MNTYCALCGGSGRVSEIVETAGGRESLEYVPCPSCSVAQTSQFSGNGHDDPMWSTPPHAPRSAYTTPPPPQSDRSGRPARPVQPDQVVRQEERALTLPQTPHDKRVERSFRQNMRASAPLQGLKKTQVVRQAEITAFRGSCAGRAGNQVLKNVGVFIEENKHIVDRYEASDLEVADKMQIAADRLDSVLINLPIATVALVLKQFDMG